MGKGHEGLLECHIGHIMLNSSDRASGSSTHIAFLRSEIILPFMLVIKCKKEETQRD